MFLRTDTIAYLNTLRFDKDTAESADSAHVALAVFVRAVGNWISPPVVFCADGKQPDEAVKVKRQQKKSLLHWAACVAELFPGMILKAVRLERTQRLEAKSRGTSGEAGRARERKAHGL